MQVPQPPPDPAVAHYRRGNAQKDAGEFAAALQSYERALELMPAYAHALCNRGVVLAALHRRDEALASYDLALSLDPRDAITHNNRAVLLQELRRWDDALASYALATDCNPGLFNAWFNRGAVHKELGQHAAALASYDRAIVLNPAFAPAHFNRGVLLQQRLQLQGALQSYEQAIALDAELFQAHFKRGSILQELKEFGESLQSYDRAIAIHPAYPEAWLNRGVVLQELERAQQALASYDQAVALNPDYAEAWCNRGMLQKELGQTDAAIASFDQAIRVRGDFADAWFGRGASLTQARDVDAALASYDRAIALKPEFAEAHYNRALAQLLAGNYAPGWQGYEWRWKNTAKLSMGEPRRFREPLWLGQNDLHGRRILIYAEQGLGDTLQFCRYIGLLAERGAQVIFEVQAPLVAMLGRLPGVSRIIAAGDPLPPFDIQCPLMSLPLCFNTAVTSIPAVIPYLTNDAQALRDWQARLGAKSRPRIGLVWSGNALQGNDRNRSIAIADLIAELPREFEYICLQKEIRATDRSALAANPWIKTHEAELADFRDTAALAATTDLVISVCTSAVHLAGALGLRTWSLLCFDADWRWLLERSDSPWYPTMTLYRQARPGDWRGVLLRVASDLRREFG